MAKKAKKKGKPTFKQCNNCAYEQTYPRSFICERDKDDAHYYCGRLFEPLTVFQRAYNFFKPKYLNGLGMRSEDLMKNAISIWIHTDGDFNIFGKAIGKIIVDCPGFKEKE